ncbi:hypothetical protein [Kitasatospora cinereorecta]|uniref:Uncharacterized protein n=1 Tax=Kitasatospora cinereorecta TaxID=285560 RepID=A0ABW0VN80_9ACTN
MYSYDVAAPSRPSASYASTAAASAARSIPSMRPSYDAEHPSSATPIYDALYSEYRRLFRALPGDRTGEEHMRFTGFAVREPRESVELRESRDLRGTRDALPYPQQQTFQTYPGQSHGVPQFMPAQAQPSAGASGNGQGWIAAGYLGGSGQSSPATGQTAATGSPTAPAGSGGRHRSMLSLPPGRGD